ncbi:ribbon-helix-helix protein, CopG family [Halalkalicoccus subterraneus]|uniref:ribbon-helix-helix protein, CopG family n=1 Tax=Halalkalicoccus subterraneus TaxID=2675002 RepID=UPI000EFC1A14|nr:ribbon-helix-helix protein, CopG family [Halalkalicoccus subterraneus]
MEAITIRLKESTLKSLDSEADEHRRIRGEHIREMIRARDEYEAKLAEYEDEIEKLKQENERIRREKRLILEQREENHELQRYVEDELSYREAGLGTRVKW